MNVTVTRISRLSVVLPTFLELSDGDFNCKFVKNKVITNINLTYVQSYCFNRNSFHPMKRLVSLLDMKTS
jgi:hypothetical protein